MRSALRFPLLLTICLASAGCGISRDTAMKLAEAGGSACGAARAAMVGVDDGLGNYVESEAFWRALVGSELNLEEDEGFKNLRKLHDLIGTRIAMISELNGMYDGLRRLAEHDFAANVQGSVEALATSAATYGQLVGATELGKLIGDIAHLVATAVQERQLKIANEQFANLLPKIIELLEKDKQGFASLIKQTRLAQWKLVEALLDRGIGEPDAMLAAILEDVGSSFDPKRFEKLDAKTQNLVRNGMKAVIELRIADDIESHESILNDSIATLRALNSNHERLNKNSPINLATVAAATARLRVIAESANAYAQAVAEARATRAAAQGSPGGLRRQLLTGMRAAVEEEIKRRFPGLP